MTTVREAKLMDKWAAEDTAAAASKPPALLESVRTARAELQQLELDIAADVKTLRDARVTWQFIGDALGITKQAAQQRYGHKDHWTAADTTAGLTPSMLAKP